MFAHSLTRVCEDLADLGLVRSKRHFSRDYLRRGWSYLRDLERPDRHRGGIRVSRKTTEVLRERLLGLNCYLSPRVKLEVGIIIDGIDRDTRMADLLYRGR